MADIPVDGLFINIAHVSDATDFQAFFYANKIFDNIDKRKDDSYENQTVFDELLYKTRFETNDLHWKGMILLAFIYILLQKL